MRTDYNRYFPTKVSPFYKQYIANTSPRYSLARPIRNNHSSLSLPLHSMFLAIDSQLFLIIVRIDQCLMQG